MTQPLISDRSHIVLHRPIYPRNIGMCARAMGNLGFRHLHIIAPRCDWSSSMVHHEARQGAAHASDILRSAFVYQSTEQFLSEKGQGVRIAFSGRDGHGKRVREFDDLIETFKAMPEHPIWSEATQIQFHFGTEDDGLSLEELSSMNFIARLPANGSVSSFNLSHAVLIALYIAVDKLKIDIEIRPEFNLPPAPLEHPKRAIREWIEALGFDLSERKISIETSLNRVLLSHCPSPEDVRLLEKVLFQTVEKLKSKK